MPCVWLSNQHRKSVMQENEVEKKASIGQVVNLLCVLAVMILTGIINAICFIKDEASKTDDEDKPQT